MNRSSSIMVLVLTISMPFGISSADSVKERTLTLQFVPQETTGSSLPTLREDVASRPIDLTFEDKRPPSETALVGEGTDDDDHPFPWRSTNPIPEFAKEILVRTAQGWGVQIQEGADLILVVRLTRFFVSEKDQAVGSSYAADVRVAFELKGRDGAPLSSGVASGDARRYGRKRSADNCNEVLSDAMKEAYANLIDHRALQAAWAGKESPSGPKTRHISPAALLVEVIRLKDQGLSSELLIGYISQLALTQPMGADDIVDWNKAGLPESVILAAVNRSPTTSKP
jgi:hypothetical protein